MTKEEVQALIRQHAQAAGIDPNHALAMASIETGGTFDPSSVNPAGTHKGLFQFGPDEWKKYGGGGNIFDPNAQLPAYVGYHNDIKAQMTQALGREPTPQELYLGWQQGGQGATSLINSPTTSASAVIGNSAFGANGGQPGQNAGAFVNQVGDLYNQHLAQVGGQGAAAPTPGGGLLQPGVSPDLAGWSNVQNAASLANINKNATDNAAQDKLASASSDLTKQGLGLLAQSHTPAPDFGAAPNLFHRPDAQATPMPNFTQALMQQRLMRRM